jgi:hypothetical protein
MRVTKTIKSIIEVVFEFVISFFFEESIVKSRLPSSTIKINPIVPIIGNNPDKSGTVILKFVVREFINIPVIMSRMTPGILVYFAVNSKIYEKITITQRAISI